VVLFQFRQAQPELRCSNDRDVAGFRKQAILMSDAANDFAPAEAPAPKPLDFANFQPGQKIANKTITELVYFTGD
jgi:hypothetical protein